MTEDEFKATIIKAWDWMEKAQEKIHGEFGGSGPDPEILAMRAVVSMMTGEPMKVDEPPELVERPPEPIYPNRDEEIAKIITETDPAEVGGIMALIVETANLRARTAFFDQGRLDYLEKLLLLARKKDAMG